MGGMKSQNHKKGKVKRRIRKVAPASIRITQLDTAVLLGCLDAILQAGGAVMIKRSSDGGALALMVFHDEIERENLWFADEHEFDELAADIEATLSDLGK